MGRGGEGRGIVADEMVETVNKYSRRAAIVQTGWKTQTVSTGTGEQKRGICTDGIIGDGLHSAVYRRRVRVVVGDK